MNLIEELGLEKCKQIVEGAPDWADIFCTFSDEYFITGGDEPECCICLENLRTEIANHERTDTCSDIKNHLSPNTKVIER